MATITSIAKLDDGQWLYTYSGTAPFRLYSDGRYLLGQPTNDTQIVLEGTRERVGLQRDWRDASFTIGTPTDTEEPPPLEVLDANDTEDALNIQFPPRMRLQWRGNSDADFYQIEEQIDSVWTLKGVVKESGQGYYFYTTDALTDGTTYNYRVLPVDAAENEGTPITYSAAVVRNPAPPRISISYDSSSNTITASARP